MQDSKLPYNGFTIISKESHDLQSQKKIVCCGGSRLLQSLPISTPYHWSIQWILITVIVFQCTVPSVSHHALGWHIHWWMSTTLSRVRYSWVITNCGVEAPTHTLTFLLASAEISNDCLLVFPTHALHSRACTEAHELCLGNIVRNVAVGNIWTFFWESIEVPLSLHMWIWFTDHC